MFCHIKSHGNLQRNGHSDACIFKMWTEMWKPQSRSRGRWKARISVSPRIPHPTRFPPHQQKVTPIIQLGPPLHTDNISQCEKSLTKDQVFKMHLVIPGKGCISGIYYLVAVSCWPAKSIIIAFSSPSPFPLSQGAYSALFLMKYALGQEDSNYSIFFDDVLYIGEIFK